MIQTNIRSAWVPTDWTCKPERKDSEILPIICSRTSAAWCVRGRMHLAQLAQCLTTAGPYILSCLFYSHATSSTPKHLKPCGPFDFALLLRNPQPDHILSLFSHENLPKSTITGSLEVFSATNNMWTVLAAPLVFAGSALGLVNFINPATYTGSNTDWSKNEVYTRGNTLNLAWAGGVQGKMVSIVLWQVNATGAAMGNYEKVVGTLMRWRLSLSLLGILDQPSDQEPDRGSSY